MSCVRKTFTNQGHILYLCHVVTWLNNKIIWLLTWIDIRYMYFLIILLHAYLYDSSSCYHKNNLRRVDLYTFDRTSDPLTSSSCDMHSLMSLVFCQLNMFVESLFTKWTSLRVLLQPINDIYRINLVRSCLIAATYFRNKITLLLIFILWLSNVVLNINMLKIIYPLYKMFFTLIMLVVSVCFLNLCFRKAI